MSPSNPENNTSGLLSKFISVVALLAAALYFTGWVYRWAYFSFFKVDVLSLDFTVESFYLAAFQALLGSRLVVLRTAIAILLTSLAITLTLQFIRQPIEGLLKNTLFRFISLQSNALNFLRDLVDVTIIILWVLLILFYLAQLQGEDDAWADAVNETSTLPVVTLINPAENSALGKTSDDPFSLSDPKKFRILGDVKRYTNLTTQDNTDLKEDRIWRLLLESGDYAYLFPALPKSSQKNLRPPVLIVKRNDNQMLIISPEAYQR